MTRDETKTIIATLSAVYPPNLMPTVNELTVNVWFQLLQDIEFKSASAAVAAWMQTNRYPPTIADIRDRLVSSALTDEPTPEEAWNKVLSAIRRYSFEDRDLAERELGAIWPLVCDWRYYCTLLTEQIPNEKARFLRAYTAHQAKQKNRLQISAPILDTLNGIKRLGAGE